MKYSNCMVCHTEISIKLRFCKDCRLQRWGDVKEKKRILNRDHQRKWVKKNLKKQLIKVTNNVKRLQKLLFEYKTNKSCSQCAENHPACLVFHHIDPQNKIGGVSDMAKRGVSWEIILEEIKKCQLLCANCHMKLHCSKYDKWMNPRDRGRTCI